MQDVRATKGGSGVVERLQERQRERLAPSFIFYSVALILLCRHQQLVSELQKELSAISEVRMQNIPLTLAPAGPSLSQILETEVRESGERLKHKLENSLHSKDL